MRFFATYMLVAIVALTAMGCSNGGAVTTPDTTEQEISSQEHQLWAAVDFSWDGVSDELDIVPNRTVEGHYNLTPFLPPGSVKIQIINWDVINKILTLEATLKNNYQLDGWDVRGILTNLGVNKHLNPDDYTKLFDLNLPPVANPFRAYAKEEPFRFFPGIPAPPSQRTKSEIYEIYFPGVIMATFMVTASYPDNADEPYDIISIDQVGEINEGGGSIDVTIEVLDWQDVTAYEVIIENNPVTGVDVYMTPLDATHWIATITNDGGAAVGDYDVWVAAYDAVAPYALYNTFTITVVAGAGEWGDPILVSGEAGVDEILPRIILRDSDYWIIYTDGTDALARQSTNGGNTWSAPDTIGTYAGIDTMHAVLGSNDVIYVQYQTSSWKSTYLCSYTGGGWTTPIVNNLMALTTQPWSCDFGIGSDGTLFDMWTGGWSMNGFHSNNPYDMGSWTYDNIHAFYNAVYSINDGFVQMSDPPKIFYIHDDTTMDYGYFDGSLWNKAPAMTGADILIEPAIAPESDGPYHGVLAIDRGGTFDVQYFRYDAWPPVSAHTVDLATGLTTEPVFHSVSVEGTTVSVLYDANGEIRYVESSDGGATFGTDEVLAGGGGAGGCVYSHIRHDAYGNPLVAAYCVEESGDYNIYIRMKNSGS